MREEILKRTLGFHEIRDFAGKPLFLGQSDCSITHISVISERHAEDEPLTVRSLLPGVFIIAFGMMGFLALLSGVSCAISTVCLFTEMVRP